MAKRWTSGQVGGLVGAAEGAPLTQGRDGSIPLDLEGEDLTVPPEDRPTVRGEPVESAFHSPTTTEIDPLPVATGECTIESLDREPLCEEE